MIEIAHDFAFEAAHRLPNVPASHKCSRLHGHSYKVTLHLVGEIDPSMGWFIDFGDLAEIVQPVIATLDHHLLNDVDGLSNPTSELLAQWLFNRLATRLDTLDAVVVRETADSAAIYSPRSVGRPGRG